MSSKFVTLAALAIGVCGAATPAAALIAAPVPVTNYITFGGTPGHGQVRVRQAAARMAYSVVVD